MTDGNIDANDWRWKAIADKLDELEKRIKFLETNPFVTTNYLVTAAGRQS